MMNSFDFNPLSPERLEPKRQKILIIKLGALGDMILSFAAMKRIVTMHAEAEIHLLTTPPFQKIAQATGWFSRIDTDGRSKSFATLISMLRRLRKSAYDRVYDLQTSSLSSRYFYALWPRLPEWSGIALGASHRHKNPQRKKMHTLERQADQLKEAGIWDEAPTLPMSAAAPDLHNLIKLGDYSVFSKAFDLKRPYILMVPGASLHRPQKLWPVDFYADLAAKLGQNGLNIVIAGGKQETGLAHTIKGGNSAALDLTGKTDFLELALLASQAQFAIGNDTGPMHLIAAMGVPSLVLFSKDSNPSLCAPRGKRVAFLYQEQLSDLSVETVFAKVMFLQKDAEKRTPP